MSVLNEKSAIEEIFKQTIAEAKAKKFGKKKEDDDEKNASDDDENREGGDSDYKDDDKSIDGEEDGKKEEDDEDKKVKKMKKTDKQKAVKEETLAASSLHPAARAVDDPRSLTGSSKSAVMQGMLGLMGTMGAQDMVAFFNKAIAEYGKGKDWGITNQANSNRDSIDMKPSHAVSNKGPKTADSMPVLDDKNNPLKSGKGTMFPVNTNKPVSAVKEDLEAIFSGQDLTEEFKESITTIFEAAVNIKIMTETARLEEEFEARLNEEFNTFTEEVTDKLDSYLDYVVENWMKENEVAIESTLRNELMSEFMEGLKNLFAEHYINVPQEKIDVLEELADKVKTLETRLDETITENASLKQSLAESSAQGIFEELASDLALTQQEKFAALAEGIEFDGDLETYTKKLKIIKENYFKTETTTHESNINEETFEGELNESTKVSNDPNINRYVSAIARSVKK